MDPFDLMAARLTAPTAPAAPERRPQAAPRGMPGARALVGQLVAHSDRMRRLHPDRQLMARLDAGGAPVAFAITAWPDGSSTVRVEVCGARVGRVLLTEINLGRLGDDDEDECDAGE